MKKRQYLLLTIFSIIFASSVSAGIGDTLQKPFELLGSLLGIFFNVISKEPAVWLKILFALAVGLILYEIFKVSGLLQPRTSGILAALVAIISIVFIPGNILIAAASLYGGLFMTIIFIIPEIVLGFFTLGLWGAHKNTHPKITGFLLALLWAVFIGLITYINSLANKDSAFSTFTKMIGLVLPWMTLIGVVFFLYFLIKGFTSGAAAAGGLGGIVGGWGRGFFNRLFGRGGTPLGGAGGLGAVTSEGVTTQQADRVLHDALQQEATDRAVDQDLEDIDEGLNEFAANTEEGMNRNEVLSRADNMYEQLHQRATEQERRGDLQGAMQTYEMMSRLNENIGQAVAVLSDTTGKADAIFEDIDKQLKEAEMREQFSRNQERKLKGNVPDNVKPIVDDAKTAARGEWRKIDQVRKQFKRESKRIQEEEREDVEQIIDSIKNLRIKFNALKNPELIYSIRQGIIRDINNEYKKMFNANSKLKEAFQNARNLHTWMKENVKGIKQTSTIKGKLDMKIIEELKKAKK